jgi:hypothetical protein
MELLQNTVTPAEATRSDLSDWVGAPVVEAGDSNLDAIKFREDRVQPDELDFAKRAFDLFREGYGTDHLVYGPGSAPLSLYHLFKLMQNSIMFSQMFQFYEGITYDSVQFRITCSAPKGIVGGFVCGVFPMTIWNNSSFDSQAAYFDQNVMTRQHLMLSPQAQLICYASAQDVVFDVPWQFNFPYLPRRVVYAQDDTSTTNQLLPGCPVLYFVNLAANYVSTQSYPAQIRVFVKFNNLRFLAPNYNAIAPPAPMMIDNVIEGHSGVIEGLSMLAPAAVDVITTAGAEILGMDVQKATPVLSEVGNNSSFEQPQAVQLAYVGDSVKYGPPSTTPIFRPWGEPTHKHPLLDLLKQPQYVFEFDTGSFVQLFSNPTAPRRLEDLTGNEQMCTYFRYFSQSTSYWRGTIIFDFVIMGHPLVEVSYNFQVFYLPWSLVGANDDFSTNSVLRGVCSGVYRVSVPMPFMTPLDHLPIVDKHLVATTELYEFSSSMVRAEMTVVSTALSAAPVIPISVFMRAGDDFQFIQPFPPGLGFVENPAPLLDNFQLFARVVNEMEEGLPVIGHIGLIPVSNIFQTRAKAQPDTKQMFSFQCIEDYMNVWSRCLPFNSYDVADEPVIEAKVGVTPFWYPQVDTDASHTLGVQNSWWVTNDYMSMYSSMFLYYRGSIGMKILCKPGTGYKYFTITAGSQNRLPGHNPFTYVASQLPPAANFGYGTVATDLGGQPVLELTLPLRSTLQWAYCNPQMTRNILGGYFWNDPLSGTINTNVVLHTAGSDLEDAMYRKIGKDFSLAVRTLLPPPTLWMSKGYAWS